jgi:hypothetical protein
VIEMFVSPVEGSRSNTGIAWEAVATTAGQTYSARSRHGAPNALARVLVAAGVEDDRVEVRYLGTAGCMSYRSLHAMAGWTFAESDAPLRRVRYREFSDRNADAGEPGLALSDAGVSLEPPTDYDAPRPVTLSVTDCARCGRSFKPKRSTATFCSGRCRVAAHRSAA